MIRHLSLIVLSLAIVGCGQAEKPGAGSASGKSSGSLRIAVVPKGTTHEFWKSVHAGARRAADELGDVEIIWKGPLLENDRTGQISVVQGFITQQVDGICLAPLDSQALVEYVVEATEENIPVVIFDSGLDDDNVIVSYVATDNREGGRLAARELGTALDGTGNVILLRYNPGSESTHQREEGFLETLKSEFPEIKILVEDEYAGTTPESSLDKANQLLGKFKDEVNGVFAVCEPNANGVLGALKEQELAGQVKFVAFDPSPPLIEGLRNDTVHGIVLQDPVNMGYQAVTTIVNHIRGTPTEPRVDTGVYIATPENLDEERMQELLNPVRFGEE